MKFYLSVNLVLQKNCDLILELLVAVGEFVLLRTDTNTHIPCSGCNMCYHALTTIGMDSELLEACT